MNLAETSRAGKRSTGVNERRLRELSGKEVLCREVECGRLDLGPNGLKISETLPVVMFQRLPPLLPIPQPFLRRHKLPDPDGDALKQILSRRHHPR